MKNKFYDLDEEVYETSHSNNNKTQEAEFGCGFCWDKKKLKSKELYFLDAANNMRVCLYCPYCGRAYEKE